MGADQNIAWAREAASALEWWRDAGVDTLVDDAARDWLTAPPRDTRRAGASPAAPAPARLPETIEAFATWRIGPDAPEAGWGQALIGAHGNPAAGLMILVDCPEREDGEAGRLLTGAAGRLFDRMLAAIGQSRDTVYLAAVAAARPISGRIPPETEARLNELARHHVTLAASKRLLLMGNAASRAVLGADVARARGRLHGINPKGGTMAAVAGTGAVASFHPRFLLERPAAKAEAWKDLQMLIEGLEK
jgi:DNA polymerase